MVKTKVTTFIHLLVLAHTALGGVIRPDKRDAVSSSLCEDVAPTTVTVISTQSNIQTETTTVTEVTTITAQPGTVTVALQGPDAIASSLNSAISIESQQIEINSQLAPINPLTSGRPPTTTSVAYFTRTIIVPVVEATKTSVPDGQSPVSAVYFIGESNGTTSWLSDFTPVQSMTIGTTTVTLSPVPASSRNPVNGSAVIQPATRTEYSTRTTTWQGTSSAAARAFSTSVDYQGWNSSRLDPAASGYSTSQGYSNIPSSFRVSTVRRTSAVTTSTVYVSASLTSGSLPTNAHGSTANITFPTANYGSQKRSAEDLRRRAVCEWVTVTMRGIPATWRNNWDGSKTVNCATVPMSTESALPPSVVTSTVTVATTLSPSEAPISSPSTLTMTVVSVSSNSNTIPTMPPAISSVLSSSTSVAPAPTASCGVTGDFTLDFDTLPRYAPPDNDTAPFPPIFNPYRHLFFSSGWAYVPPPTVPVIPQNGSHLAVYVPTASETNSSNSQSQSAGEVPSGAFGAGPRAYDSAYWFNVKSLYVFCDNGAIDPAVTCDIVVTGYKWDNNAQEETNVTAQHFPQPPCPGYRNCQTNQIFLDEQFSSGLSSLSLYATVNGEQKMVFMDTVQLTWSDNSCEAGLHRASQI